MKFLNTVLLFASGSMAAMGTAQRRVRMAERLARYQSQPAIMADAPTDSGDLSASASKSYTENWAGAVKSKTGLGVSAVQARIIVPAIGMPKNGTAETDYHAAAWVGIDGYQCGSSILQTGIDIGIMNGKITIDAWFEWYPEASHSFDLVVRPGDTLRLSVKATSKTTGVATIDNLTSKKSANHSFTGRLAALCETDAEWIVERYHVDDDYVPFADFNTLTFSQCSTIENGKKAGLTDSDVLDLVIDRSLAADCNIQNDSTLRCDHID
ncbi:Aspergillopepsin-2 [Cladobotryum mycophilum]|uniref:Aspergillopepsin-2 n=1 Tax=Cladobotryum mycophilum TaxID=491253 RepID=A0ABR0SXP4_9HYPO